MPFVESELKESYGESWWNDGVEIVLSGKIGPEANSRGTPEERYDLLDVQALLTLTPHDYRE